MPNKLGFLKEIIKTCPKKALVSDADNNFYGLWNLTHLPLMSQPGKLPLFFYGFISVGEAVLEVDLKPYSFSAGDIFRLKPSQTLQVLKVSEEFCCSLFIFDKKVVSETLVGIQVPLGNTSPQLKTSVSLRKSLSTYLAIMFEKLEMEKTDKSPYLKKIVEQVMRAMLCEIFYEISRSNSTKVVPQTTRAQDIVMKFTNLVGEHFKRERSVNFYAEQLKLTPKYLCKIVSECTGTTPSQYIDQKVLVEAKYLLQNTTMSVAEISQELNFANQSFFAKYFKGKEGCSPLAFRNS